MINAMNADMPFDQFTIEQLAGDLLPDPTIAQKIATGFHRQSTCNVEAGVDPEQNRINQVMDRINTTGMVWLGTTLECAQCHDHKYDPLTQKDFYSLFAFFNSLDGNAMDGNKADHAPALRVQSPEQLAEIARLKSQVEQTRKQIAAAVAAIDYVEPKDAPRPAPVEPKEFVSMMSAPASR